MRCACGGNWLAGAAFAAVIASACVAPKTQRISLAIDGELVAGSNVCATVAIQFSERPPVSQPITLTTTLGVLDTTGATPSAMQKKVVLTTGELVQRTPLCPGLLAGPGVLSGLAATEEQLDDLSFVVDPPPVTAVYVDLDRDVLHAPDATATTARITLFGAVPGATTAGTRVSVLLCCAGTRTACTDFVVASPFIETTIASPNMGTATVRLTPDGESYTRGALAGASKQSQMVTVIGLVAPAGMAPQCADFALEGDGGLAGLGGVVAGTAMLQLSSPVVDAGAPADTQ